MIRAYTGLTGSGKTLSMVRDASYHFSIYRKPIYSNFKMSVFDYSYRFGIFPHQLKTIIPATVLKAEDFIDKMLEMEDALFLVDEAGFVFNNRLWKDLPFDVLARFNETRKVGVDIFYTTQNITRVDKVLRDLTHVQVMCRFVDFPTTDWHMWLKNEAFTNQIIGHDSKANRDLYYAWNDTIMPKDYKKYYKMYDTMERIPFSVVRPGKKFQKKEDREKIFVAPERMIHEVYPSHFAEGYDELTGQIKRVELPFE